MTLFKNLNEAEMVAVMTRSLLHPEELKRLPEAMRAQFLDQKLNLGPGSMFCALMEHFATAIHHEQLRRDIQRDVGIPSDMLDPPSDKRTDFQKAIDEVKP